MLLSHCHTEKREMKYVSKMLKPAAVLVKEEVKNYKNTRGSWQGCKVTHKSQFVTGSVQRGMGGIPDFFFSSSSSFFT